MKTRIIIKEGKIFIEGIDYQGDDCLRDLEKLLKMLSSIGIDVNVEFHRKKTTTTSQAVVVRA
jgi:hypothetical protein